MSFWQAARREASGALRSIRYDVVRALVAQHGSRRVLAVTGLTALIAAGGIGTAFAFAGGDHPTPARADDRPAVVSRGGPASAGDTLTDPTGSPTPSTSRSALPEPSTSASAGAGHTSTSPTPKKSRPPKASPHPSHGHKGGGGGTKPTHRPPEASTPPPSKPSPSESSSPTPDPSPSETASESTPASTVPPSAQPQVRSA